MNKQVPYAVILIELFACMCLFTFSISVLGWQLAARSQDGLEVSSRDTREEIAPATVSPTVQMPASPTATPLPPPTITPTPDPRVMLSDCATIDKPGLYQLAGDLELGRGDCLKVQTSNVTLNCAGHDIVGGSLTGSGIIVKKYGLLSKQVPSNVEIKNCRISKFKYGIYVEAATRLFIHDNESSNNYDDVDLGSRYGKFLGMTEGGGIRVNFASDSQIRFNVTSYQAIGIDVRDSNHVQVNQNTASGNSAWGINFVKTVNSEISSNSVVDTIRQCTWGAGVIGFGCDASGIMLQDGSSQNMVVNNWVTGQNGNGIFIKAHAQPCGDNNAILGNTIAGALYNSVELGFCAGNKISGNTMRDSIDAVLVSFAHDTEIKNNTIMNMRNHGILSPNSYNVTVSGNRIVNSNEGVYLYTEGYDRNFFSWLPDGEYRSHGNCVCNNVFEANSIAIRIKDSTMNRLTDNNLQGNKQGIVLQGKKDGNDTQGNIGLK